MRGFNLATNQNLFINYLQQGEIALLRIFPEEAQMVRMLVFIHLHSRILRLINGRIQNPPRSYFRLFRIHPKLHQDRRP